jgi:hypothetical protein
MAAIGGALLLATGAAALWLSAGQGRADPAPATPVAQEAASLPDRPAPAGDALEREPVKTKTREEQRFARADRDDDGRITQAEYLTQRRRNFDKLDANGNGRLEFEEYAESGIEKFREADANADGQLLAAEFATTAPRPRAAARACSCPEQSAGGKADEQG